MNEILHAWVYVMIPVETPRFEGGYRLYAGTSALFCAFCKQCRQYFTEPITWDTSSAMMTKSNLPRSGCSLSEPSGLEELG